jgi:protein required for attachment to host cells
MKRACIAIVDVTRARICEYDERGEAGQELTEIADLISPGRRHVGELFETEIPGERGGDSGGPEHQQGTDDHRRGFVDHLDHKFAHDVVGEIDRLVKAGAFTHLIVVAGPRMLGDLRRYDAPLRREGLALVISEVERDLAGLSNAQLHDHLAQLGIIPPRQRLAAAR